MSEQEQQEVEFIGPGQMLREAREKAGLSTDEMAKKLHLRAHNIVDIESDLFDENISLTFTKGYIKLYAKHVNVPEAKVLEAFEHFNIKKKEPAKLQSFSKRVAKQANDDRLMLVTYLVLAVVVALVFMWWFQQSGPADDAVISNVSSRNPEVETFTAPESDFPALVENTSVEQDAAQAALTAEEEAADDSLTFAQPDIDLNPVDSAQEDEVEATIPEDFTAPASTVVELPDSSALVSDGAISDAPIQDVQPLADPVELVFEFAGDCWMNLTDATGEAIAYGVKVEGRVMPVSGIPPFEITLGAPEVVSISYDGVPVDMSIFPGGRTAKFNLPFAE